MSTQRLRVGIVGGSGYAGGELLRLLLSHPHVEVAQVASGSHAGKFVHTTHPNLRKRTDLKYVPNEALGEVDVLFVALPHGKAMSQMERYMGLAPRIIDLSADFRLRDPAAYPAWYGHPHSAPALLERFTYGIPELHRAELREARYATGAGCLATATILGLWPLFKRGVIDISHGVFVEAKVGSSAAGAESTPGSHHADRSHAVRSFEPTGHRHTAEVEQELGYGAAGQPTVHFSATAIELVRGALATAHVFLNDVLDEKAIWQIYRQEYGNEPFIRIIKGREGVYRYPEPKILAGSNYCDIGFELDTRADGRGGRRLVVMSAIDNLMKGAAGNAVQAMNVMCGFDETTALDFPGLHPV